MVLEDLLFVIQSYQMHTRMPHTISLGAAARTTHTVSLGATARIPNTV